MKTTKDPASGFIIEPLAPARAKDFEAFFSGPAFSDNPAWSGCWCTFFHRPAGPAEAETLDAASDPALSPPAPRETARAFSLRLVAEGRMRGYLAYEADGSVAAWLNAAPKDSYARFRSPDGRAAPGDEAILEVTCFVVRPDRRRSGLATALLARAISDARAAGFAAVEGRPAPRSRTDSGNFHGPRTLFERAGFTVEKRGRGLVARLELRP
jgi:GNAT superfamily N-acetyltransferase